MAQPEVEPFDLRWFSIKATGTPDDADDAFRLLDGSIDFTERVVERKRDSARLTNDDFSINTEQLVVTGDFEINPPTTPGSSSGTLGQAPCDRLLLPAALERALSSANSTTRYTPISTGVPDANTKFWQGGVYWLLHDGFADIGSISFVQDEIPRIKGWKLTGDYESIGEEAVPSAEVTDPLGTVMTPENSVCRIFQGESTTALPLFVHCREFTVALGNDIQTTNFTQLEKRGLVKRKGTFTLVIARTALADFDPWAVRRAGTVIRSDIAMVDQDNTRYSRAFFRGKIEKIQNTKTGEWFTWTITGRCIASSTGNDDYGLEFGLDSLRLIGDLPDAAAGAYSASLSLQGIYGSAVTYSVQSGSLPAGTSLNTSTGVVSGTATAGTTSAVIRATTTALDGTTITADSSSQSITIT